MPLGASRFGLLGGVADLGKLELIETQTASADSSVDFIDLATNSYNVYFLTMNLNSSTSNQHYLRLSTDNGSSFISSGYQYAFNRGTTAGSFFDSKSTSSTQINTGILSGTTTNRGNAYIYFYNLLDSSKYSFCTFHSFSSGGDTRFTFGSGVLPTSATHNALQILPSAGTTSGTVSLYGIAES